MYMDTQTLTQVVFHLSDWCSDSIMTWSYQKRDNLISVSDILLVKWVGPDNISVIKVEIGHTSLTLVRTTVRWLWNQHTCLFYSVLGSVTFLRLNFPIYMLSKEEMITVIWVLMTVSDKINLYQFFV